MPGPSGDINTCHHCKTEFPNDDEVCEHIIRQHGDIESWEEYQNPSYLERVATDDTMEFPERTWMCRECNKRFLQKNDVRRHIYQVHRKREPFPCDMCNARHFTLERLKRHRAKDHFGTAQDRFVPERPPVRTSAVASATKRKTVDDDDVGGSAADPDYTPSQESRPIQYRAGHKYPPTRIESRVVGDDTLSTPAVKAIADLIEEGVRTKSQKQRKSKDEMERDEHEARVRLMKAQTNLCQSQEKAYTLVGHGLTSFLSTFDDILSKTRGKSMIIGGMAFKIGGGGSSTKIHEENGGDDY